MMRSFCVRHQVTGCASLAADESCYFSHLLRSRACISACIWNPGARAAPQSSPLLHVLKPASSLADDSRRLCHSPAQSLQLRGQVTVRELGGWCVEEGRVDALQAFISTTFPEAVSRPLDNDAR
jgi:hypothetical protein